MPVLDPTDERGWATGRRFGISARAHPRLYKMARPTTEPKVSRGGDVHHLPPPAIPHPPAACYSQHRFMPYYPTRKLAIVALDSSVRDGGGILRTQIEIPNESL